MRATVAVLLVVLTLGAFGPVLRNGFIDYDDDRYVSKNPHVQQGLSGPALAWACTATYAANWHPATWISHMADWELYARKAGGHHATSLLLHLANTLLLFWLFERMTGAVGRSAFVAAAFAVHPLHVQSVAWVAERKDVLSTFFWLAATLAYVRYVRAPRRATFALVCAAMALGLAAKPMLVTLPVTLLLLDFWPLERLRGGNTRALLFEKLPLAALSVASAAITLVAQRAGGAIASLESVPLPARLGNGLIACVAYLWQTIRPAGLSVFYPLPAGGPPVWQVAGAALFLATVTWLAFRLRRSRSYLLAGWLWYLVTLIPVLGLVQVGDQARADRYTYVPLIGIFWIVAWVATDLLRARPLAVFGTTVVLGLAILTRVEVGRWRSSVTLFEHALEVEPGNYVAHNNLGVALAARGRQDEALRHYAEAVRLRPGDPKGQCNLAGALVAQGRVDEAYPHAVEAVRLNPRLADARYQLAVALSRRGQTQPALEQYEEALRLAPDDAQLHNNLGTALARLGRGAEALAHFEAALRIDPHYGAAHANLAAALFTLGRYAESWEEIARARRAGFEPPRELVRDIASKLQGPPAR